MDKMNILITGGAGFMGSNFARHMVKKYPGHNFINYDKLTYAGNLRNFEGISEKYHGRYEFVKGCINDSSKVTPLIENAEQSFISRLRAMSIDRS